MPLYLSNHHHCTICTLNQVLTSFQFSFHSFFASFFVFTCFSYSLSSSLSKLSILPCNISVTCSSPIFQSSWQHLYSQVTLKCSLCTTSMWLLLVLIFLHSPRTLQVVDNDQTSCLALLVQHAAQYPMQWPIVMCHRPLGCR